MRTGILATVLLFSIVGSRASCQISEWSVPGSPAGITTGPDGNIWFALIPPDDRIGRISPLGNVASLPLPGPCDYWFGCWPDAITPGPDGVVWFTELRKTVVGRVTPAGAVTEIEHEPFGGPAGPSLVVFGGYLWAPIPGMDRVVRIALDGSTAFFATPPGGSPQSLCTDGTSLWIGEKDANRIVRMSPDGTMTLFPLGGIGGYVWDVVCGPDGGIWYIKNGTYQLGRLDPETGDVEEFSMPTPSPVQEIAVGPDSRLWITEYHANKIASFDIATRTFQEYAIPTPDSGPQGIAAGPDGRVWFGETAGNKIGAIATGAAPTFGLKLYALPPCRLVDTRAPAGPLGGPALDAGAARTFALAGTCGVPPEASALAVNVTVVNPSANGHLRIWAALSSSIATAAFPIRFGRVRANGSTVNVSGDGTASIKVRNDSEGSTDFLLDVNGYFAGPQYQ